MNLMVMVMKAYSTASGAVMFVPETLEHKTAAQQAETSESSNTLMAKPPMSYKALAGTPTPVHIPQSDADALVQQKQAS